MTDNIFKKHNLRITDIRKEVLDCFVQSDIALSHSDIELLLFKEYDRVTIYRTLNSFLEKGILHKVFDDSGVAKFALCKYDCNEHQHNDNHVHFKCEVCSKVICFHDMQIPHLPVLKGFSIHHINLLVQGICPECQVQ
ncbi:MAG: transcriptional repressor [Chitinophagales bacterium]|nr:transcriptional repressor [Chitinophagales bacterium]